MSKVLIIIGLLLTGFVTVPLILLMALIESSMIYKEWKRRPDAPPLSKDEWKSGL